MYNIYVELMDSAYICIYLWLQSRVRCLERYTLCYIAIFLYIYENHTIDINFGATFACHAHIEHVCRDKLN